jgi:c-di-GMP-binding flagellar brake protein YcgR
MAWKPRQHARFKATLPIELRPKGVTAPLRGQTADICLGGCYVEMGFTQEVSTMVDISLWLGDSKIYVKAEVVSKHPSFGNGFRFVHLTKDGASKLTEYLESLKPQGAMNDSPFAGPPPAASS